MENETAQLNETKVDQNTSVQSAEGDRSPASPSGQTGVNNPSSANNLPDIESHPRWKGIQRENARWKKELEASRNEMAQMRGMLEGIQRQSQSRQGIDPDKETALSQLFELAFQSPKVMQMLKEQLGVNKLEALEKQVGDLSSTWYGSQANTEMKGIRDYVQGIGLDPDEVEDTIKNAIEDDPIYSQISYRPGAYKAVFNNLYFEKAGEFRQRADNKKQIEEREALKRGQTQVNSASQSRPSNGSQSAEQRFVDEIRKAGGVSGIDFGR